ncbi:MAG TPA: hypothetical protein VK614_09720 [Allosphingosinicella sp.]|nr:hypothetical protein [Allosphingosinicella sp.]
MITETETLDEVRGRVLDRMEAGRKLMRFGTGAAALLEAAMLAGCVMLVDWHDRTQVLLFLIFILSYFIIVLCMLALAGYLTLLTGRILAALDARADGAP